MARSQPYTVACNGGLVKSANSIDLLKTPGVARELRNFEVSIEGGYRRINGFTKFGTNQPSGSATTILGVMPYADGVVVCTSTNIYFTLDGTTYLQINKLSHSSGDNYSTFTGKSVTARTGQGQIQFAMFEGAAQDYGTVIIADGANKPFSFRMEGTGALSSRTYFTEEVTVTGTKYATFITSHDHHLIAAGVEDNENTVYYSIYNDPSDFGGTGAGAVTISDKVVGVRGFRQDLFIFCENSIHKLININNSQTVAVVPVAENVGCLSGYSIQEIGGDLIFLAPDGLRTVAGTARIGDVELGTVSKAIQPLVTSLAENINNYTVSSLVLREKSQYRLFYTDTTLDASQQKGIIGTLRADGFQWSETRGIEVTEIGSGFDANGVEKYYHGSTTGYVYIHYLKVSSSAEGIVEPDVQVRFEYGNTDIPQPPELFDLGTINPPSIFGEALFNTNVFGGAENPMIRVPLQGSGTSNNFTFISEDNKAPYTINGLYVDFIPSGRR